jgi:hypothetical protein
MRRFGRVNCNFRCWLTNPSLSLSVDVSHEEGFTIEEWLIELDKVKKLFLPAAQVDDWYLTYFVVMDCKQ